MKIIKNIGLLISLIGVAFFIGSIFVGDYQVTEEKFNTWVNSKGIKSEIFIDNASKEIVGKTFSSSFQLSSKLIDLAERSAEVHKKAEEWNKVIWVKWDKVHKDFTYPLLSSTINSPIEKNQWLYFFLTFGLAIIGGILFILPDYKLLGPAGIKNNALFQHAATNRGWIGMIVFILFVSFYIALYFFPDYLVNPILTTNPISMSLSGNPASQWFMYGFIYCSVMTVFAIKMYIKYRHNLYQIVRTTVVLFFQIAFAFLIPEILVRFNQPWFDFKNAWPLNYTFFFDWNINSLIENGNLGLFMLVWGIVLTLVIVPVMVYFYGKRWYCSWVCGCGGLAETLGDPYRHLSDKSMKSWKFERYIIHAVLVFAIIMTIGALSTFFTESTTLFGIDTSSIQGWYGFLIGSIFSGVK